MGKTEADRYAIVFDGIVANIVLWDGDNVTWTPPAGAIAVLCPDDAGIGWTYAEGSWAPPSTDEVAE